MRYAIILIISVVTLTFLGTLLHDYQGFVTITLPQGRYEMQLWYFALALFVFLVLAYLLIKCVFAIIHLPKTLNRFSKSRRHLKANNLLKKGMQAMGKGHWRQAEKWLVKGAKISEQSGHDSTLFWSNAAEAAQNQDATSRRDEYLLSARQLAAEGIDTLSSTLVEAELYLKQKQPKKALEVLFPQHNTHFLNPKLISLEIKAYTKLEDYENAWLRLGHLKKYLPNKETYIAKQSDIATALFHSQNTTLEIVEKAWHDLPKAIKQQDEMLLNYASALMHHEQNEQAEKLLEKAIKAEFSDPLIHAYTQIDSGSSRQKLQLMQRWLKFKPENAYLNYGAAKFAFASDELELAKEYAQKSLDEVALPEVYHLLGEVAEALGQKQEALDAYKSATKLTYGHEQKDVLSGMLITSNDLQAPGAPMQALTDSKEKPND